MCYVQDREGEIERKQMLGKEEKLKDKLDRGHLSRYSESMLIFETTLIIPNTKEKMPAIYIKIKGLMRLGRWAWSLF